MLTLTDLPLELLDEIVSWAIQGETFRRARHLSNYSLVGCLLLTKAASSRLFEAPEIVNPHQAAAFLALVTQTPHLARCVKALEVHSQDVIVRNAIVARTARGAQPLEVLGDIVAVCARVRRMGLSDVLFEPSLCPTTIANLSSLTLLDVKIATFLTPLVFLSLQHLSVKNVDATFMRTPLHFPSLLTLSYHNDLLDTDDLPVLRLNSFHSTHAHLQHLSVGRLFDPASDWGFDALVSPTLAPFDALVSLRLLADSSHRAAAYFPLLDSLTSPITSFSVATQLGYRDKQQEVQGMATELLKRLHAPNFAAIEEVTLTAVFRAYREEPAMKELLAAAEGREVRVRYGDK